MTQNDLLAALPLADRLRAAAVDLALTGAPRALVVACCLAAEALEPSSSPNPHCIRLTTTGTRADALRRRLVEARQIFREIVASDTHRG